MLQDKAQTPVSHEDDSTATSESEPEMELMVTSRAKRATAGNRYNTLVAQEEAAQEHQGEDDDVALLFAEVEGEDEEYESDEGGEDADMSSSDDDDQGPNTGADDLEGEKELEKQAKIQRAKKRKADLTMTTVAGIKKKSRMDLTSQKRVQVAKPTKRKERTSWLPDQEVAPGRTSLRKQTIVHRAETHARLKESEKHRMKMKAIRAQRELEREADAPQELTQADRLAEAERVERRNAKSLNRWEAMEKKRQEEQAAKLAALKERKLQGAVVSFYSARHVYDGYRSTATVEGDAPPEGKKRGRKSKAFLEQQAAMKLLQEGSSQPTPVTAQSDVTGPANADIAAAPRGSASISQVLVESSTQQTILSPPTEPPDFLSGIEEYAALKTQEQSGNSEGVSHKTDDREASAVELVSTGSTTQLDDLQPEAPDRAVAAPSSSVQQISDVLDIGLDTQKSELPLLVAIRSKSDGETQTSIDTITIGKAIESADVHPSEHIASDVNTSTSAQDTSATLTTLAPPVIKVVSSRNLVILDKFDELTGQARDNYGVFYNNRKTVKPTRHGSDFCPMTGLVARYRDPASGIGYHNASAYKKLKEAQLHQYTWSSMLGCYAGRKGFAARGIPDGFLGS